MDVSRVASLANLPLSDLELQQLALALEATVKLVDHVLQLNTANTAPTSQVTGLTNVTRPDVIDTSRILSQSQALSNAKSTQDGYFKVPALF
jgi:aspartyl-tRNA(Asn)/glutamyl-tRNA(Gln) amidotransferase subunit C